MCSGAIERDQWHEMVEWMTLKLHIFFTVFQCNILVFHCTWSGMQISFDSFYTNVESYQSLVKLKTIATDSVVCWQLHHYNFCYKKAFVTWFLRGKLLLVFQIFKVVLSEWNDNLGSVECFKWMLYNEMLKICVQHFLSAALRKPMQRFSGKSISINRRDRCLFMSFLWH